MNSKHSGDTLYSQADLAGRDWTCSMIERHLAEPDAWRPSFFSDAPARPRWLKERVHTLENGRAADDLEHTKSIAAARIRRDRRRERPPMTDAERAKYDRNRKLAAAAERKRRFTALGTNEDSFLAAVGSAVDAGHSNMIDVGLFVLEELGSPEDSDAVFDEIADMMLAQMSG